MQNNPRCCALGLVTEKTRADHWHKKIVNVVGCPLTNLRYIYTSSYESTQIGSGTCVYYQRWICFSAIWKLWCVIPRCIYGGYVCLLENSQAGLKTHSLCATISAIKLAGHILIKSRQQGRSAPPADWYIKGLFDMNTGWETYCRYIIHWVDLFTILFQNCNWASRPEDVNQEIFLIKQVLQRAYMTRVLQKKNNL